MSEGGRVNRESGDLADGRVDMLIAGRVDVFSRKDRQSEKLGG